jgi:hypothetical protein
MHKFLLIVAALPQARKASLARFFEKRRERSVYRSKFFVYILTRMMDDNALSQAIYILEAAGPLEKKFTHR